MSTYAEAARRVKQVAKARIQREQAQTTQTNESMKQLNYSTDSINMSKSDFVAFICAVMNGTAQVGRRSDKKILW